MQTMPLNPPQESFRFRIPDYGLDHQGGAIVDLLVTLDFIENVGATDPYAYPEFVSIVNHIKDYLVAYPNEGDFWEILNKNLVTTLLRGTIPTTFGVEYNLDQVVEALTVELQVEPGSSLVNFPRSSVVKGSPDAADIDYDQRFSFAIPDYGLDHQGGAIVDIAVDLDFKEDIAIDDPFEYPEFVSIVNFIKDYLVNYPNETDFWEILNKNLVTALLRDTIPTTFGVEYNLDQVVDSLTVDIQVEPGSSLVNFPRSSTVTGSPTDEDIDFDQSFSFAIPDYGLDHQGGAIVDIAVDLDFKEDIAIDDPFEYPEFVSIVNFIKDYLVNYPNETDFWEILNKNLVTALLRDTIPTTFGVEYNLDQVVDSLTVDIQVESGSSLVNYPRSSVVKGSPDAAEINYDQSFSFEIQDYGLDHQGGAIVDIAIDLNFKEDIAIDDPFEYPEFVSIVNFIKDYLVNYPNETDFWEILNKNLTEALLTQTIPTTFGVEYHLDNVVESLSVDIQVQSGSSLVNYPRASAVSQSVAPPETPFLRNPASDVFAISGGSAGTPKLQISFVDYGLQSLNDFAVFTVDDAEGNIDGISPDQDGYTEAVLDRARSIFFNITDTPTGFDPLSSLRSLAFNSGDNFRFLAIQNDTLDHVRSQGITNPTVLFASLDNSAITEAGQGVFRLTWKDGEGTSSQLQDLVIALEATDAPQPLGANLQGQQESEIIDLRGIDPSETVQASFSIYREAAFNNTVGFYQINDLQGTIVDSVTGAELRPGDAGYAEAAVRNQIPGIDLSVSNQSTTTASGLFQGGALFAPFMIVDGSAEQLLDGTAENDPSVYLPFIQGNADRVDHVRLLADNTFGFEDLASGGDNDCNDLIVRFNLAVV